jgi:hypothetical protein
MKSTILKAFALPLAAFALASAGAASTADAEKSKTSAVIQAYIHNPAEDDCEPVTVNCEPGNGQLCTSGSFEAYGKINENSDCNVQLRRL